MGKKLEITKELREKHPNIDFDDFKFKKGTQSKLYRGKCPRCEKDRGYIPSRSRWNSLCRSCNGIKSGLNNMKNKEPHNKGKKTPQHVLDKLSRARKGKQAWNKGIPATKGQRIKQSCKMRNIEIDDFDDFTAPVSKRERVKFDSSNIRQKCYENANYTCDLYGVKGVELNAHHLDSWHSNENKRFKLDNLVCLSKAAHKTFHNKYGNKNNTKEQYEEFKIEIENHKQTKQDIFLIAGCPAAGKSWVCNQLQQFNYVSYDNVNKNYHIYELLKNNNKQLLYDPTIKISTFTKRYSHLFNIRLIVIIEDEQIINQRILDRGGKLTDTIKKRIKRMEFLSKECEFSGTSSEVLEYLKTLK